MCRCGTMQHDVQRIGHGFAPKCRAIKDDLAPALHRGSSLAEDIVHRTAATRAVAACQVEIIPVLARSRRAYREPTIACSGPLDHRVLCRHRMKAMRYRIRGILLLCALLLAVAAVEAHAAGCDGVTAGAGSEARCLQARGQLQGLPDVPRDGGRSGRHILDGLGGEQRRDAGSRRDAGAAIRGRQVRGDVRGMGCLRRRRSVQPCAGRSRLRPPEPAGDRRVVERRDERVPAVAVAQGGADLSPVERGRVGVRSARRQPCRLCVGRRDRRRSCQLRPLRQRLGQPADGAGRLVCRQRVRPARSARQRLGVDAGLLSGQLRRRAQEWVGAAARQLPDARRARRRLERPPALFALGHPLWRSADLSRQLRRVPRGAGVEVRPTP